MKGKQNVSEEIANIIKEAVEKMGFSFELEVMKEEGEQERIVFNIKTEESNFLIGQYGANLDALQHIIRLISQKKLEERVDFFLDVNFYRQEKNEAVISLAKNMAEKAISEKRPVVLRPMSAYERRLVHMALAKNSSVRTESTGEGEERKVVIKATSVL